MVKAADSTPTDAQEIQYDPRNPFVICAGSYSPIYRGSSKLHCSLCGAAYIPGFGGKGCVVCGLGTVGAEARGLSVME